MVATADNLVTSRSHRYLATSVSVLFFVITMHGRASAEQKRIND